MCKKVISDFNKIKEGNNVYYRRGIFKFYLKNERKLNLNCPFLVSI